MNISSLPVSCFEEMFVGIEHMLELSPYLKKLSLQDLYSHIAWHWNHGTIAWVSNSEKGYVGLCIIRLLTDLNDIDQLYVHDPDGQYLLIEEVVSDGPETWQGLFDQLYEIWGERQFIMWDRRERTEKKSPRIYTWDQYLKILRRLTRERPA